MVPYSCSLMQSKVKPLATPPCERAARVPCGYPVVNRARVLVHSTVPNKTTNVKITYWKLQYIIGGERYRRIKPSLRNSTLIIRLAYTDDARTTPSSQFGDKGRS